MQSEEQSKKQQSGEEENPEAKHYNIYKVNEKTLNILKECERNPKIRPLTDEFLDEIFGSKS